MVFQRQERQNETQHQKRHERAANHRKGHAPRGPGVGAFEKVIRLGGTVTVNRQDTGVFNRRQSTSLFRYRIGPGIADPSEEGRKAGRNE